MEDIRTDADLISLLASQLARLSDGAFPLGAEETRRYEICTRLTALDPSTIKHEPVRKRACMILRDLAKNRAIFFLCSIGTLPYKIGKLKSSRYMEAVTRW